MEHIENVRGFVFHILKIAHDEAGRLRAGKNLFLIFIVPTSINICFKNNFSDLPAINVCFEGEKKTTTRLPVDNLRICFDTRTRKSTNFFDSTNVNLPFG